MIFFRQIFNSCTNFSFYDEVINQSGRKTLSYLLPLLTLFSIIIFPVQYNRNTKNFFESLDYLANKFPPIEFESGVLTSVINDPIFIETNSFDVLIDPLRKYSFKGYHTGEVLIFLEKSLAIKIGEKEHEIPYKPFVISLFNEVSPAFSKGSGVLDGHFFTRYRQIINDSYIINALMYGMFFIFMGLFYSFLFSIFGYIYSRLIVSKLNWKQVRTLSIFAMTPALVTLSVIVYLGMNITKIQPVLYLVYFLFLGNSILRFSLKHRKEASE